MNLPLTFLRRFRRKGKAAFLSVYQRVLVVGLVFLAVANLLASPVPPSKPSIYPSWWFSQDVIARLNPLNSSPIWPSDYPIADDYALVNEGQLKNFATAAYTELQAKAPSYVWSTTQGTALTTLVTGWSTPALGEDDYQGINLGQLKTVSKTFYDVLIEIGYTTSYPWTGTGADDYAAANIGQFKNAFKFDVGLDTDANGLPDWWEMANFGHLGNNSTDVAPAGNGLTIGWDYQHGNDPNNYYSQGGAIITPTLTLISTNNQSSPPGTFVTLPLIVKVTNSVGGAALVNAPVTFTATVGGGLVAATSGGAANAALPVRTDGSGFAQIYFQQSTNASVTSTITATTASQTVNFTATSTTAPLPANWTGNDLGTVGVTGSSAYDSTNKIFYVSGAGAGMVGTSDAGHLISTLMNGLPLTGNIEMIARVSSEQNTGAYATAGLMMRESNAANAVSAYVAVSPTNGLTFTTRSSTGATSVVSLGASQAAPVWLRLVRSATTITVGSTTTPGYALAGYYSTDGITWTLVGRRNFAMAANVLAGMAVSSTTTAATCIAAFDHVDVEINVPQTSDGLMAWYRADAGIVQSSGLVSQWLDQSSLANHAIAAQTSSSPLPSFVANTLNGKPVVRLTYVTLPNGYNSFSVADTPTMDPSSGYLTMFVVALERATSDQGATILSKFASGNSTGYGLTLDLPSNPPLPTLTIDGLTLRGALSLNTWAVMEGMSAPANRLLTINGIQTSTSGTLGIAANASPLTIGRYSNIDIAEIILYNAALTDVKKRQVESYLYQKYAIANTQPTAFAPLISNSLGSQTFTSSNDVTLTPSQPGDTVYYTTDGSDPTSSGTRVSITAATVVHITTTTTFRVIEAAPGYINSPETKITYTQDSTTTFPRTHLMTWYRSDLGVTISSGAVTQWADQSSNLNTALAGPSHSTPISLVTGDVNGLPGIRFSIVDSGALSVANNSSLNPSYGKVTIFAVGKPGSTPINGFVSKSGGYALTLQFQGSGSICKMSTSVAGTSNTTSATFNTWAFTEGLYDQTNLTTFINGTASTPTAYTTPIASTTTPLNIGGSGDFDVAEVLIFNDALSQGDRQAVEAYLHSRYNLGSNPVAVPPSFSGSIPAGIYWSAQTITLNPGQNDGLIYYTTDGSTPGGSSAGVPTGTSQLYTGPFTVSSTTTVKTMTVRSGMTDSPVVSATYQIDTAANFPRSGLMAWYRSDVGVTVTSGVSQWNDQSGLGNHLKQTTAGNRPSLVSSVLNGQPIIHFTHTANSYLSVADNATLNPSSGQITLFAVARETSGTTNGGTLVDKINGTNGYSLRMTTATIPATFVNGTGNTVSGTLSPTGTWAVLEEKYDQKKLYTIVNGTATQTPYSLAINTANIPLSVGGLSATGNTPDADIAEVLVFNSALSDTDKSTVESYLSSRYGITITPSTPLLDPPIFGGAASAGVYTSAQIVTLTPAQSGDLIYYTTDGSTPAGSGAGIPSGTSILYSGGITVNTIETIKAKSVRTGWVDSTVVSASFAVDPTAVFTRSNMMAWYRADVGVITSSSLVTKWTDLSGNNNHALSVSGTEPSLVTNVINSQPVIRFTSNNDYLSAASNTSLNPSSGNVTIIAVVKTSSSSGVLVDKLASGSAGYSLKMASATSLATCINSGSLAANRAAATYTSGSWAEAEGIYDGTADLISTILNGGAATTKSYATNVATSTTALCIGGLTAAGSTPNADIAEVMIFDSALSTSDRQYIEGYLHTRYGLGTTPTAPIPSFGVSNPPGLQPTQTITLNVGQSGELIYYTTDGSTPSGSTSGVPSGTALLYTGPFQLSSSATVKAIAVQGNFTSSSVISSTYTIDSTTNFSRAGLMAWYRSDRGITTDANGVNEWDDQSGNSNHLTQTTNSKKPNYTTNILNGHPALHFVSSTSDSLSKTSTATLNLTTATIFAVSRATAITSGRLVDKWVSPTGGYSLRYNSNTTPSFYGNTYNVTGTMGANTWAVLDGVYSSTAVLLYVNGTMTQSTATGNLATNTQPLSVGGLSSGSGTPENDLTEVLVFNYAMSDTDRQAVEHYLNQRYVVGIPTAMPPVFSSQSGTFPALNLSISPGESGETIYYTTDGSTPTTSSAVYGGTPLSITSSATVKAFATKPGWYDSAVTSTYYKIDSGLTFPRTGLVAWYRADLGTPTSGTTATWPDQSGNGNNGTAVGSTSPSVVPGTLNSNPVMRFTYASNNYFSVPNSTTLNPSSGKVTVFTVAVERSGTTHPGILVNKGASSPRYGLQMSTVTAPYANLNTQHAAGSLATGAWGILEEVYDLSKISLYVNGTLNQLAYASSLTSGTDPLTIGGAASNATPDADIAEVMVYNDSLSDQDRIQVELYLSQRYSLYFSSLTGPQFSMAAGALSNPQAIALTAPAGSTIYYTLDGSTPTTTSLVYTGPIYISYSLTIKAIAYKDGYQTSSPVSAAYTLNPTLYPAPAPGNPTPPSINLILPSNAHLL